MQHVELNPAKLSLAPYDLGFCLLARKQQLKLDFDAGGSLTMELMIRALIGSGFDTEEEIVDEISDITGPHCQALVRTFLMEGENIGWRKCVSGRLELLTAAG